MADSKVDITAGAGIEIDTRTESTNSQHRQVVVIGDPAANTGVAPVDGTEGLKVDTRPATPLNEFGEDTGVVSSTDTNILVYTPGANTANIQGFMVNGTSTGRYKLLVNGAVKSVLRTSAANRTESIDFSGGVVQGASGATIAIAGFHEEVSNQTLNANVYGYLT